MRTLDDFYGADNDRFPLEQEMSPPRSLVWEDELAAALPARAGDDRKRFTSTATRPVPEIR